MLIAWMEKIEKNTNEIPDSRSPNHYSRGVRQEHRLHCVLVCCSFDSQGQRQRQSSFRIPWFTSMFRCSHVLCCMFVLSLLLCYIAFVYEGQAAPASPSPFSTCIPFFVCSLFIVTLTCLTSTMTFLYVLFLTSPHYPYIF